MKTTVFNLIILDESGSMSHMTQHTLSGCNETLNVIRSNAKENADTLNSFVSIFAFQDGGRIKSRYLVKNARPEEVRDITEDDYKPCGNTPLFDAVGSTLAELKAISATHESATGVVTIITDGYENSSTHYTGKQVADLIALLREIGWTINLVGADIDVERMARDMNINSANAMAYHADAAGTGSIWRRMSSGFNSRMNREADMRRCHPDMSEDDRRKARRNSESDFFN